DYRSSRSDKLSSEDENEDGFECDTDLDEGDSAKPEMFGEYHKVANKYDDTYEDVEGEDHTPWTVVIDQLSVGKTWPNMKDYKKFVTNLCIDNLIKVGKVKDEKRRLYCKCVDDKCTFMLNGNL
ncbi:hypothetical protein MKX01_034424, partial [Papaver californicum]